MRSFSKSPFSLFVLPLVAGVAFSIPAAAADAKSPTAAAKAAKVDLVQSQDADIDGDGKNETVGVCKSRKKGFFLCVFTHADEKVTLSAKSGKLSGKTVGKLKFMDLVKPKKAQEVVVEMYAETPDERIKRLYVFEGKPKLRQIFKTSAFQSKDKSERADWARDPEVIKWGNAKPGWYFQDLEMDGSTEIIVRKKPKMLKVPLRKGAAKIVVGAYEKVYGYEGEPGSGEFQLINEARFVDFAPQKEVSSIKVSSQHLPKDLQDQMKADAMANALYGEEGGGNSGGSGDTEHKQWVADSNYDTGWLEGARGMGKGEKVELFLSERSNVHMVRVVPGCVMDKRSFRRHNVPRTFSISLDGFKKADVNTARVKDPGGAAVGILAMPIKDRPWAKQYLVFFDGKTSTGRVVLELGAAKKQGSGNHTCVSEIAVH
jgi:hypothetical protein